MILHLGDFVSVAFLAELEALGPPVEGVHGNVDEPAVARRFPRERVLETGGRRVGLLHDAGPRAGREERLAIRFPECEAILYGHSHVPQVDRFETRWILNPGSPTERRSASAHSMIWIEVGARRFAPRLIHLP